MNPLNNGQCYWHNNSSTSLVVLLQVVIPSKVPGEAIDVPAPKKETGSRVHSVKVISSGGLSESKGHTNTHCADNNHLICFQNETPTIEDTSKTPRKTWLLVAARVCRAWGDVHLKRGGGSPDVDKTSMDDPMLYFDGLSTSLRAEGEHVEGALLVLNWGRVCIVSGSCRSE